MSYFPFSFAGKVDKSIFSNILQTKQFREEMMNETHSYLQFVIFWHSKFSSSSNRLACTENCQEFQSAFLGGKSPGFFSFFSMKELIIFYNYQKEKFLKNSSNF
jgi:hypothetical protein